MYNSFFKAVGIRKVFGLSATCFRQDVFYKNPNGWSNYGKMGKWEKYNLEAITTVKMCNGYKNNFWHRMLHVVNIKELVEQGYLSRVKYHNAHLIKHEDIKTNKSKSDFDLADYEEKLQFHEQKMLEQIKTIISKHKSVLIFCSSVEQSKRYQDIMGGEHVDGKTTKKKREEIIKNFRSGKVKVVWNVGVLTTGFDFPALEAVCLIRPTRSLGLYMQMAGRVMRVTKGKDFGYLYDFSGTVESLGILESVEIKRLENRWNVVTNVYKKGIVNAELYSFDLSKRKK
jgi:DNA repair protein RadD